MGSPPPADAPPPQPGDTGTGGGSCLVGGAGASAGLDLGPPVLSLCGFKLPLFLFHFALKLPSFSFILPIPKFRLSIGLNCDLSNPLDVSAGVDWGGGRVPCFDPDPDELAEAA